MLYQIISYAAMFLLVRWSVTKYLTWMRQRSPAARERAIFKQRLPGWVKSLESLVFIVLIMLSSLALLMAILRIYGLVHPNIPLNNLSNITNILLAIPCFLIAVPLAGIFANIVSWLIPPVKKANEIAMEGLPASSYKQSMHDLLMILAWATPLCLAILLLGIVDPWMH